MVFENDSISEYEHLLRTHTNDGLAVNCMSIYDFKLMCKQLLSPMEIIEYLKWREAFYKKNGPINLLITETNNGFVLSKPQKNEIWYSNIYMRSMEKMRYTKTDCIMNFLGNMY